MTSNGSRQFADNPWSESLLVGCELVPRVSEGNRQGP